MFVEKERDVGLERRAGAIQDNFWGEFGHIYNNKS
jgi:hypothetical protein